MRSKIQSGTLLRGAYLRAQQDLPEDDLFKFEELRKNEVPSDVIQFIGLRAASVYYAEHPACGGNPQWVLNDLAKFNRPENSVFAVTVAQATAKLTLETPDGEFHCEVWHWPETTVEQDPHTHIVMANGFKGAPTAKIRKKFVVNYLRTVARKVFPTT